TSFVSIPKQRFRPRATLYSPPPSHTRSCRAVWMRPSPGSRRSITSPSATRSQRRPSFEGIWIGISDVRLRDISREQQRSSPRAVTALVQNTIVKAVRIARPELDPIGHDTEAAPERRARDGGAFEPGRGLAHAFVERHSRGEHVALRRRPGADLEFARARREVRVGLVAPYALGAPFDADLRVRRPIEGERGLRIRDERARLAARHVRVEDEAARV